MLNCQAAEDIDKQRKDAEEQRDAQAKLERSERAKRNAELVAQQKVFASQLTYMQFSETP